jgi:hypothetical protein
MQLLKKKSPASLASGAEDYCKSYRRLASAFEALDLGPFSPEHLRGAVAAEPRTEKVPSATGCKSCAGILNFPSGRVYVESFLLDQAEPRIGGLKIAREKLRALIELPAEHLLEAFDKSVEDLRRHLSYERLVRFNTDGQPEPDKEAIEREAEGEDLVLAPRHERLVTYLTELAQRLTEGPDVLGPMGLKFTFELQSPSSLGSGTAEPPLIKISGVNVPVRWELNEQWVLKALAVPRRTLPKD